MSAAQQRRPASAKELTNPKKWPGRVAGPCFQHAGPDAPAQLAVWPFYCLPRGSRVSRAGGALRPDES
jgi:hypothetical protein